MSFSRDTSLDMSQLECLSAHRVETIFMKKNIPWAMCWVAVGTIAGVLGAFVIKADDAVGYLNDNGAAVTAIFTIVLAFSTVGLWQATYRLWDAAERQMELTRQVAVAGKASAEAAKEAVDLGRVTAEHQLRAYISTHSFTIPIGLVDQNGRIDLHYMIKNDGQTPANNVVIHYGLWLAAPDEKPEWRDFSMRSGSFNLAPGRSIRNGAVLMLPLGNDQWNRLRSRALHLHFFGQVDYTDVFGHPRKTQFFETTGVGSDDQASGTFALGAVEIPLTVT